MVPQKLQLRNFMCYGEDLAPLQFDGIKVACLSGANGAGKSTLLDAITWALWGEARAKSDDDLIMLGRDEMEVVFEFLLDDHPYRVVRRRKRGKRTTTAVEFHIQQPDGSWQQITADTATETQRQINRTLRMEYDTFINSAFLLQGHADEFASRKPAERKQVLADILGLAEYEELERRAREMLRQREREQDRVQAHITQLESEIAQRPELEQRLADAQQQVAMLDEAIQQADDELRDWAERAAELANQRAALQTMHTQRQSLEHERRDLADAIGETAQRVTEYDALIVRQDEIEAGVAQLAAARAEASQMEAHADEYHRLNLEFKDCKNALHQVRQQLEQEQARYQEQLAQFAAQRERHTAVQQEHDRLQAELGAFANVRNEWEQLRADEEALREQQTHAREAHAEIRHLEQLIASQRSQLEAMQRSQQQEVERWQAQAAALPHLQAELADAETELARMDTLARDLADVRQSLTLAHARDGELKAEEARITREGKEARETLAVLDRGEGVCPICHNDLGTHGMATLQQHYGELIARLRIDLGQVRGAIKSNQADIAQQQAQVDEREALLVERSQLEARRAELQVRIQQAHAAHSTLTATQAALDDTTARLGYRQYALDEQQQLARLRAQAVQLGDPGQLQQQLNAVRQQIEQANQRLDKEKQLQQQLARLETETTLLNQATAQQPAVQQRLDAVVERLAKDDYGADERRAIERLKAKSRALGYNRDAHLALRARIDELAQWERDAVRLEEVSKQAPSARIRLRRDQAQLQRIDGELARLADDIAVLQEELAEQQMVERQRRAAEQRLETLRGRLAAAQSALGRADAELRRCGESEQQLREQQAQATQLAEERAIYEELVLAFGKKGIQAMLIETAIPEIEHEANQLLSRMTDGQMHVALETQRDAKVSNTTIETLDIRIWDTLGVRDYNMYSGGEAFRVNFAIRIALSKLLARRAGASLKTLIIDEGFGTQDTQGRDRIVEAINAIENEFERILVITHIQELKDMFPAQIEITKTAQGSQWAIA